MTSARITLPAALQRAALLLFALTVLLSVAAVNLRIGPVPVRSVTLLVSGLCLFFPDPALLRSAAHHDRKLAAIIGAMALLGLVVSLLSRAGLGATFQQIVEIHLQALVGSLVAYGLMLRFGIKPIVVCFLIGFGFTVLVGFGQALHIDIAWRMRAEMGKLMHDAPDPAFTYLTRYRVLGMSFSPVHFATHSCLALAGIFYMRAARTDGEAFRLDWVVLGAVFVLAALCVLTGNRSPLLGIVIFIAIYVSVTAPRAALALLPFVLIAALAAAPLLRHLSEAGLRVAETDNSSAAGRATLRAYGLFLIGQRPIGYGLTFDSLDYWTYFAHQAGYLENPLVIRRWAVHNCYLNIMAKYGVFVLGLVPFILPRNRHHAFLWLAFIPYAIHIFYHNDGPFQGDFMIFYVLPAAFLVAGKWRRHADAITASRLRRPWRRAFATAGAELA